MTASRAKLTLGLALAGLTSGCANRLNMTLEEFRAWTPSEEQISRELEEDTPVILLASPDSAHLSLAEYFSSDRSICRDMPCSGNVPTARSLDVSVNIENVTDEEILLWEMSCDWHSHWATNNPIVVKDFHLVGCDGNTPVPFPIAAGESVVREIPIGISKNDTNLIGKTLLYRFGFLTTVSTEKKPRFPYVSNTWDTVFWSNEIEIEVQE